MNLDMTPTHALPFWINGIDYRLHYEAVGLYALYPNRTLYQLTWPQVVRRIQAGCDVRLVMIDDPEETPHAIAGAVTVTNAVELVALFNVWCVSPLRRGRAVAA